MPTFSNTIKASDAIICTIMSFLDKKEIYKCDFAWLMYFISKSIDDNSIQNEEVFLSGVLNTYKDGNFDANKITSMSFTEIRNLYLCRIANFSNFFNTATFSDKFILSGDYSIGIKYIAEIIEKLEKSREYSRNFYNCNYFGNEHLDYKKIIPLGMGTSNLYVFVIILIVALRNDIPARDRMAIFIRLNTILDSNFTDYIFEKYKIKQEPLFLKGKFNQDNLEYKIEQEADSLNINFDINNIVLSIVKFLFDKRLKSKMESDLYKIASEMYNYSLHFKSILQQLRNEHKSINKSDIFLTNNDLKYAVSYCLIGYEETSSITDGAIGNKNENFYYWIKKISEPYIVNYFLN
ncbi:MAG: hypothetical protein NC485_14410 [Ruminococcus flavefaciens]|nr:hypothetical protein [Ruminococcus flavefaciens]